MFQFFPNWLGFFKCGATLLHLPLDFGLISSSVKENALLRVSPLILERRLCSVFLTM